MYLAYMCYALYVFCNNDECLRNIPKYMYSVAWHLSMKVLFFSTFKVHFYLKDIANKQRTGCNLMFVFSPTIHTTYIGLHVFGIQP